MLLGGVVLCKHLTRHELLWRLMACARLVYSESIQHAYIIHTALNHFSIISVVRIGAHFHCRWQSVGNKQHTHTRCDVHVSCRATPDARGFGSCLLVPYTAAAGGISKILKEKKKSARMSLQGDDQAQRFRTRHALTAYTGTSQSVETAYNRGLTCHIAPIIWTGGKTTTFRVQQQ